MARYRDVVQARGDGSASVFSMIWVWKMQIKSRLQDAESLRELSTLQKPVENIDKNLVTWLTSWPVSSVTTSYFTDEETAALNKKSSIWVQWLTRESES